MTYRPDDSDGITEFGALVALLLAGLGMVILAYILMPTAAGAMECRERPDGRSHWMYRRIEGQRCWYRGHRMLPRSRLYWPDEQEPEKVKGDPIPQTNADSNGNELKDINWHMKRPFDQAVPINPPLFYSPNDVAEPECCWPDLSEFDRRFTGVQP